MQKYKSTIRIPTEQYAYIEIDFEGTPEEIINVKNEFNALLNPEGISAKDFNTAIDRYLTNGTGDTETFISMSQHQQDIIQTIKRAFKRINK